MRAHTTQDMDGMDDDNTGIAEAFSFGWAIKLLDPGQINGGGRSVPQVGDADKQRAAYMNDMLFEYLEDQSASGRDMDSITDGEVVHTLARLDANRRDTTPGNVLQWMGRNCRIISSGSNTPSELYTKEQVDEIKKDIKEQEFERGFERGYQSAMSPSNE